MGQCAVLAQRPDRGQRPYCLLGHQDLVGSAQQVVCRVLADVADRGDTGGQRPQRVLKAGREADHVVAEVRLDRRRLAEPLPLIRRDAWPGLFDREMSFGLGHTHRPVESKAEPVDGVPGLGQAGVYFGQRGLRGRPRREADVHVVHHAALIAAASLVLRFGPGLIGA